MNNFVKDFREDLVKLLALGGDLLDSILERKFLLISATALNLGGTFFGFYWYRDLLFSSPVVLAPLIPDSPISTLLISTSFALYLFNRSNSYLDAFAFIGNVKYGLWTVFVQIYLFQGIISYSSWSLYLFITLSHFLMGLQALLILRYTDFSFKALGAAFLWYLLNDLLDYVFGVHASLPDTYGLFSVVSLTAFLLTFTASGLYIMGTGQESVRSLMKK